MATYTDQALITKAIEREVQLEVRKAVDAEVEAAKERIAKVVKGEVDKIALRILSEYDIQVDKHHILISVRQQKGT